MKYAIGLLLLIGTVHAAWSYEQPLSPIVESVEVSMLEQHVIPPTIAVPKVVSLELPPPEHKKSKKKKPIHDCDKQRNNDLMALACNVYHESGNQSVKGKELVAWATYNRYLDKDYPDTIAGVVWDWRRHYKTKRLVPHMSWTKDGKSDIVWNAKVWETSLGIAYYVLSNPEKNPIPGVIMWHADYVKPPWRKRYQKVVQVQNHIFYKRK